MAGSAPKAPAPERISDHNHVVVAGLLFVLGEGAPTRGSHAQGIEQVRGCADNVNLLGGTTAG